MRSGKSSSSGNPNGSGAAASYASWHPEAAGVDTRVLQTRVQHLEVLYRLSTDAVGARDLLSIYAAALDAVLTGLGADRASLLLFDPDGVLRFKASRGLSADYMRAVEGHTPWTPETPDPEPILVPDVDLDADLRPYRDVIRGEGIRALAFVPLRHDGRVLGKFMSYFDAVHEFTQDEVRLGEMIANHLAMVIARRQAEDARETLHAQREAERTQLEAVLRHMPVGVAIVRPDDGEILLRNALAEALWPQAEAALQSPDGLLPRVTERGEVVLDEEVPYDRVDGTRGHVSLSVSPIRGDDGSVASIVVILEDISQRKKHQTALRFLADATVALAESLDYEQTLRKVAELMVPQFADWCDFDLITEDGQIQLISVVHTDPEKVQLAHDLRKRYPPSLDGAAGIGAVVRTKQLLFAPTISEELLRRASVDEAHFQTLKALDLRSAIIVPLVARGNVLGTLTLIMAESGRHYTREDLPYIEELAQSCALAIDNARLFDNARREIAERQKAEAALRDSEERYRMLSEATTDYIFSYRKTEGGGFELEWISEAFERITGHEREDILNRERWAQLIPPEDAPAVLSFSEGVRAGNREVAEHRFRFRDGRIGWLRIYGRPIRDERTGEVVRILGAGQDITARKQAEEALQELADQLERRVAERTSALAAANARLRSEVVERAHAEEQLERANAALRASNRELQDFAYVASHDLQEPLRKIQSFADLLKSDYGPRLDDQGKFFIERMQTAAERMSDLIKGLLSYSRVRTQGLPFQPVDLDEVVRDVISDLEITIAETRGAVSVQSMPTLDADPTQMRQLFQNLIGNALKFRAPERPPVVRVKATENASHCTIEISDNGIGFSPQYSERIFAPFQRLHGRSAYAGTGMGLAICRRIVERHGGSIEAVGSPEEGATFTVTLPLRQTEQEG